jgi:hypothetical protein
MDRESNFGKCCYAKAARCSRSVIPAASHVVEENMMLAIIERHSRKSACK